MKYSLYRLMGEGKLSRREFIRMSSLLGLSTALTSCRLTGESEPIEHTPFEEEVASLVVRMSAGNEGIGTKTLPEIMKERGTAVPLVYGTAVDMDIMSGAHGRGLEYHSLPINGEDTFCKVGDMPTAPDDVDALARARTYTQATTQDVKSMIPILGWVGARGYYFQFAHEDPSVNHVGEHCEQSRTSVYGISIDKDGGTFDIRISKARVIAFMLGDLDYAPNYREFYQDEELMSIYEEYLLQRLQLYRNYLAEIGTISTDLSVYDQLIEAGLMVDLNHFDMHDLGLGSYLQVNQGLETLINELSSGNPGLRDNLLASARSFLSQKIAELPDGDNLKGHYSYIMERDDILSLFDDDQTVASELAKYIYNSLIVQIMNGEIGYHTSSYSKEANIAKRLIALGTNDLMNRFFRNIPNTHSILYSLGDSVAVGNTIADRYSLHTLSILEEFLVGREVVPDSAHNLEVSLEDIGSALREFDNLLKE